MTLENVLIFIINTFLAIIEALMGIRFFLKMLGASPNAPFVMWLYQVTNAFLEPFSNMFPSPKLGQYFEIEFTTLFAMLVYAAFSFFAVRLVEFVYTQVMTIIENTKPRKPHHDGQHHGNATPLPR